MKDDLIETLYKKAKGYNKKEVTSEFVIDDEGNRRLVKEKIQTKHYPPDNAAIKSYLDYSGGDNKYEKLSDAELEAELQRLFKELKEKQRKEAK